MKDQRRYAVAGSVAGAMLDVLLGTVRFEREGVEKLEAARVGGAGFIFVLWHGRLLPLSYLHRTERAVTLVSQSADGEYIARVVQRWGYTVVRGSSSRRGTGALRQLVRYARSGRILAITPDGPRGPMRRMKPGALLAAQLAGIPIVPVSAGTDRAWWFGGWDRFLVPQPFAKVRVAYGSPTLVPRGADEVELKELAEAVERELNRLTDQVDGT